MVADEDAAVRVRPILASHRVEGDLATLAARRGDGHRLELSLQSGTGITIPCHASRGGLALLRDLDGLRVDDRAGRLGLVVGVVPIVSIVVVVDSVRIVEQPRTVDLA